MGPSRFLPYGRHELDAADRRAIEGFLDGESWLTQGPAGIAFEKALAERVDAPYVVAVSSGTAALHLAAAALNLDPGKAGVVPAMTFAASANCVKYCGLEVAFVDVEPETGLIDTAALETRLKAGGVQVVVPVHYGGQPTDMEKIWALKKKHGFAVIEDAAHSLGATYGDGRSVGGSPDSELTIFSFHPVKHIAAGEGGAIATHDETLYHRLRALRNIGIVREPERFTNKEQALDPSGQPNPWYYEIHDLGFNYRMPDMCAVLAHSQLNRLDHLVKRRRELATRYRSALADNPYFMQLAPDRYGTSSYHLEVILLKPDLLVERKAAMMRRLRDLNVGTQVHYIPVPMHPLYQRDGCRVPDHTMDFYRRAISVPLFPGMEDDEVDAVVAALSLAGEETLGGDA